MTAPRSILERAAERWTWFVEPPTPVVADDAAPPVDTDELLLDTPVVLACPAMPSARIRPPDPAAIDLPRLTAEGVIAPADDLSPLVDAMLTIVAAGEVAPGRVIVIAAARPGDGATFCAVNLALAMAGEVAAGVVLVDATGDAVARLGLTDIDVPREQLAPTGVMGLSLLATIDPAAAVTELVAADPRRVVLIDAPLAVAATLAPVAGLVLLVVHAEARDVEAIHAAAAMVAECATVRLLLNRTTIAHGGG